MSNPIMVYQLLSKCAGCDQRNANIYNPDTDDMYCHDCHLEKQHEDECYCDDDKGLICDYHYNIIVYGE